MTEEQARDLAACLHGMNEVRTQMNLVVRLLNGNPDEDIVGIRPRLRQIEEKIDNFATTKRLVEAEQRITVIEDEWTGLKNKYKGAAWALGLLGVSNVVTLVALIRFLLGIH